MTRQQSFESSALTRDFEKTVKERVRRDAAFGEALAAEAEELALAGETKVAKAIIVGYLDPDSR